MMPQKAVARMITLRPTRPTGAAWVARPTTSQTAIRPCITRFTLSRVVRRLSCSRADWRMIAWTFSGISSP